MFLPNRRTFLADVGMGFTGLALGAMLHRDGIARRRTPSGPADGKPHFPPKAKSRDLGVPLRRGESARELRPQAGPQQVRRQDVLRHAVPGPAQVAAVRQALARRGRRDAALPEDLPPPGRVQEARQTSGSRSPTGSRTWPSASDDLAFVRSMYTTDNDHGAEFQMHTGRHQLDEQQPCIGSWVSYGLGTLNENLPQFVFLGQYKDVRVKKDFAADYLGPRYAGVELSLDPKNPLPFADPRQGRCWRRSRRSSSGSCDELNELAAAEYPDDEQVRPGSRATNSPSGCRRRFPRCST